MQAFDIRWTNFATDQSGVYRLNAANAKNALRMAVRTLHPGARATLKPDSVSTPHVVAALL